MRAIKKAGWIIAIVIVLALALLASIQKINDYYVKARLEPEKELQQALSNLAECKNYRYQLLSEFIVDERREVISQIDGEKEEENTHIKGEMVNTPVDIYYFDQNIYNYDSFSKKWLVIDSDTSNSEELLISELNPLSNFRFKNVKNVEKVKFEKVDGVECLIVKCQPAVETELLENMWKDFQYEIWIDFRDDIICQANLEAINKANEKTKLEISVQFSDFNKKIGIKPPDTGSKVKN